MVSLVIKNLSFARDNHVLFHSLNCTLESGEILQVQGQNGTGKSTLLRIIAGYIEPQEGSVEMTIDPIDIRYLGHQNALQPHLTAYENLKWYSALMRNDSQNYMTALTKIGLQSLAYRPISRFSAGQARRLALAKLLLAPGKLWILDEPATALDKAGQALLKELVETYLKQGGMIVVASHHDITEAISHRLSL